MLYTVGLVLLVSINSIVKGTPIHEAIPNENVGNQIINRIIIKLEKFWKKKTTKMFQNLGYTIRIEVREGGGGGGRRELTR